VARLRRLSAAPKIGGHQRGDSRLTADGDPRRLWQLERSRPIDVSVALALAVWRVVVGGAESVYATGPLTVIAAAPDREAGDVYYVDGERLPR
jgi:hypothetical protein